MRGSSSEFSLTSSALQLDARETPWDAEVFGFPVAQIQALVVTDPAAAMSDYQTFRLWLDSERFGIVSCRLPHERLRESMFLEANGFRFIEMNLHPTFENLPAQDLPANNLVISTACESDLSALQEIAECAFKYERYHIDPRLNPRLGDLRYARWVKNSFYHLQQRLLKVTDGEHLVAVFIVEGLADGSVYWHLTAIASRFQGQGYGQRVWRNMLRYHQAERYQRVTTTISARNSAVLNLYAKLGFRFLPPEMTFHWVREGV